MPELVHLPKRNDTGTRPAVNARGGMATGYGGGGLGCPLGRVYVGSIGGSIALG